MGIVFYVGTPSDDNAVRLTDRHAKRFLPLVGLDPNIAVGTIRTVDAYQLMRSIRAHRARLGEHRIGHARGRLSAKEKTALLGDCSLDDVLDWLRLVEMVARDADMARGDLYYTRRRIRSEGRRDWR